MTLRVKRIIPIIKCRVCGEKFQPKKITEKMCSQICRVKWTTDWHSNRNRINKKIRYSEAKKLNVETVKKQFLQYLITEFFVVVFVEKHINLQKRKEINLNL